MYYRFGKVFYYLSLTVFIVSLMYFYAALPEKFGFTADEQGIIIQEWSKDAFFYTLLIAFLGSNLLTLIFPKAIETKTSSRLHRLFPIGDPYRDYMLTWFYTFGAWVNVNLGLAGFVVQTLNDPVGLGVDVYSLWFYLAPSLLVIWVIGLFVLLLRKINLAKQKG